MRMHFARLHDLTQPEICMHKKHILCRFELIDNCVALSSYGTSRGAQLLQNYFADAALSQLTARTINTQNIRARAHTPASSSYIASVHSIQIRSVSLLPVHSNGTAGTICNVVN